MSNIPMGGRGTRLDIRADASRNGGALREMDGQTALSRLAGSAGERA
ncbi:hypothetical protein HNQ07_002675 [Deinococcus metalli]|uniref:Uncharacterized protein n=1 Tax=Deinococcus metalli TaxID=1141878 RepID=A0A7W8KFE9_9DEIO|nr:hypothetical protein [Deinococcus metalli]